MNAKNEFKNEVDTTNVGQTSTRPTTTTTVSQQVPVSRVTTTTTTTTTTTVVQQAAQRIPIATQVVTTNNFGWIDIDAEYANTSIPYLIKNDNDKIEKYFSVRIVERMILSKFSPEFPPAVRALGPLQYINCTEADALTLNEINSQHVNMQYGTEKFTIADALVKQDDFLKFYEVLKSSSKTAKQQVLSIRPEYPNIVSTNNIRLDTTQVAVQPIRHQQPHQQQLRHNRIIQQPDPKPTTSYQMQRQPPVPSSTTMQQLLNRPVVHQQHTTPTSSPQQSYSNNNGTAAVAISHQQTTHNQTNSMQPDSQETVYNSRFVHSLLVAQQKQTTQNLVLQQQQMQVQSNHMAMLHPHDQYQRNQSNNFPSGQRLFNYQQQHLLQHQLHQHQQIQLKQRQQLSTRTPTPSPPMAVHIDRSHNHQHGGVRMPNQSSDQYLAMPQSTPLPAHLVSHHNHSLVNAYAAHQQTQLHQHQLQMNMTQSSNSMQAYMQPVIMQTHTNTYISVQQPVAFTQVPPPYSHHHSYLNAQSPFLNYQNHPHVHIQNANIEPSVIDQRVNEIQRQHMTSAILTPEESIPSTTPTPDTHQSPSNRIQIQSPAKSKELQADQVKQMDIERANRVTQNKAHNQEPSEAISVVEHEIPTNFEPPTSMTRENAITTDSESIIVKKINKPLLSQIDKQTPVLSSSKEKKPDSVDPKQSIVPSHNEPCKETVETKRVADDENEIVIIGMSKARGGWLQFNDLLLPYVESDEYFYRLSNHSEKFARNMKYAPCPLLIAQDVLTSDMNLTTIRQANKIEVDYFNNLMFEVDNIQDMFDASLKLVNVFELHMELSTAYYVKKLPVRQPKTKIIKFYHDVLNLTGGIILLKQFIIPFVVYENKKLVPGNCVAQQLNAYNETTDSLAIDNQSVESMLGVFKEFFEFILMCACIETNLSCVNKLLDLSSLIEKFPNDFRILCEYTNKFPLDWKYSIRDYMKREQENKAKKKTKKMDDGNAPKVDPVPVKSASDANMNVVVPQQVPSTIGRDSNVTIISKSLVDSAVKAVLSETKAISQTTTTTSANSIESTKIREIQWKPNLKPSSSSLSPVDTFLIDESNQFPSVFMTGFQTKKPFTQTPVPVDRTVNTKSTVVETSQLLAKLPANEAHGQTKQAIIDFGKKKAETQVVSDAVAQKQSSVPLETLTKKNVPLNRSSVMSPIENGRKPSVEKAVEAAPPPVPIPQALSTISNGPPKLIDMSKFVKSKTSQPNSSSIRISTNTLAVDTAKTAAVCKIQTIESISHSQISKTHPNNTTSGPQQSSSRAIKKPELIDDICMSQQEHVDNLPLPRENTINGKCHTAISEVVKKKHATDKRNFSSCTSPEKKKENKKAPTNRNYTAFDSISMSSVSSLGSSTDLAKGKVGTGGLSTLSRKSAKRKRLRDSTNDKSIKRQIKSTYNTDLYTNEADERECERFQVDDWLNKFNIKPCLVFLKKLDDNFLIKPSK